MRPHSIAMFEKLYLSSLAIGLLNGVFALGDTVARLDASAAIPQGISGTGFAIFTMVFVLGISLLFWFFIARRGSNIAKWILVAMSVLGLFTMPSSLAGMSRVAAIVAVVILVMQFVGIGFLFRSDARAWFATKGGRHTETE